MLFLKDNTGRYVAEMPGLTMVLTAFLPDMDENTLSVSMGNMKSVLFTVTRHKDTDLEIMVRHFVYPSELMMHLAVVMHYNTQINEAMTDAAMSAVERRRSDRLVAYLSR